MLRSFLLRQMVPEEGLEKAQANLSVEGAHGTRSRVYIEVDLLVLLILAESHANLLSRVPK